ncbi:hypothetical protein LCL89_10950 [Halobacillus yeomjeoni]|uniref:hypothetical protein n=1 Tax=Halobacillus yeomjeoni TaxID=311194 RepID=UPI001CD56121|nr:hypothetical protein [Halobacillus yeomjeoni]MCA0984562.1 hypothetical protein [Halobacillus yeomjeoni]
MVTIITGTFFIYRYIRIEQDAFNNNGTTILFLTTIIGFVTSLFFREFELVLMLVLQYFVVLGGSFLFHYAQASGRENKIKWQSFLLVTFFFMISMAVFLYILQPLRIMLGKVLTIFHSLLLGGLDGTIQLLNWMGFDFALFQPLKQGTKPTLDMDNLKDSSIINNKDYDGGTAQKIAEATETGMFILIIVISLIVLYVMYRFRKRGTGCIAENQDGSYQGLVSNNQIDYSWIPFNFKYSRAQGGIRKEFERFEAFADEYGLGRGANETVDEWFKRIGLRGNAEVYYEVRYGQKIIENDELKRFIQIITQWEQELKEMKNREK